MNRFLLMLSSFLIIVSGSSQTNVSDLELVDGLLFKKGEDKPFSGKFTNNYADGSPKITGEFSKGKLNGLKIKYHENGNKIVASNYSEGILNGLSKEYYDNGSLKQEGAFLDGKEEGIWIIYHLNGKKSASISFTNGIQNGFYYQFDKNEELLLQYYYRNGTIGYSDEFKNLTNKALSSNPEEAIKINPTVDQAYFNRATQFAIIFDFENAIKDYTKAIEINPEYKEAYANRGISKINIYTSKGDIHPNTEQTKTACEDLNKAKELGDESVEDMLYSYCNK